MEATTPMKAIRLKCLDCCCVSAHEANLCNLEKCPLHPYRFGKNPYRKKIEYTEEQREMLKQRFLKKDATNTGN